MCAVSLEPLSHELVARLDLIIRRAMFWPLLLWRFKTLCSYQHPTTLLSALPTLTMHRLTQVKPLSLIQCTFRGHPGPTGHPIFEDALQYSPVHILMSAVWHGAVSSAKGVSLSDSAISPLMLL